MLTAIVPYFNGEKYINSLLSTLPEKLKVIISIDKESRPIPDLVRKVFIIENPERGYFAGNVNYAISKLKDFGREGSDVLILNQDVRFKDNSSAWLSELAEKKDKYGLLGEFVEPNNMHKVGYIHGTFMYIRHDVLSKIGVFRNDLYPHWGVTCLYQMTAARNGFLAGNMDSLKGTMVHARGRERYGSATKEAMKNLPEEVADKFIKVPPLVSVVVPTYNYGKYLPDLIKSLFESTFQSFEVVVVDDNSSDNTQEIMKEFESPWTYVRYFRNKKNLGTPGNRNRGIELAGSKLIFMLDGDDYVKPDGLERMFRAYTHNPEFFIYTDMHVVGINDRNIEVNHVWTLPDFDPVQIGIRNFAGSSILFRKSWWSDVGGYPSWSIVGHDDWAFNISLTLKSHCGLRVQTFDGNSEPCIYYRKHGSSRNSNSRKIRTELDALRRKHFPKVYEWLKEGRAMGCNCGRPRVRVTGVGPGMYRRTTPQRKVYGNPKSGIAGLEKDEIALVEYLGNSLGDMTVRGRYTKRAYTYSSRSRKFYMEKRDASALVFAKPKNFRLVKEEKEDDA